MPVHAKEQTLQMLLEQGDYLQGKRTLVAVLEDVQAAFGYVPEEGIALIASSIGVIEDDVASLIRRCSDVFRISPLPEVRLRVCQGPVCLRRKGSELLQNVQRMWCNAEASHCLGACDLAPVVRLGDRLIGEASEDAITQALNVE